MKLAGQEHALKPRVPMKDAKRGLKLCDSLRERILAYVQAEDESGLEALQKEWAEFCGIAFEKPEAVPPVDGLDVYEVIEATVGFTQARSRTSASVPSVPPSKG
jgi:hypothetical protein